MLQPIGIIETQGKTWKVVIPHKKKPFVALVNPSGECEIQMTLRCCEETNDFLFHYPVGWRVLSYKTGFCHGFFTDVSVDCLNPKFTSVEDIFKSLEPYLEGPLEYTFYDAKVHSLDNEALEERCTVKFFESRKI